MISKIDQHIISKLLWTSNKLLVVWWESLTMQDTLGMACEQTSFKLQLSKELLQEIRNEHTAARTSLSSTEFWQHLYELIRAFELGAKNYGSVK